MIYMIKQYTPSESESAFTAAYLNLFNSPDAFEFLTYTFIPFDETTVENFLRTHREHGVEYHVALNSAEQIIGIAVTQADPIRGFEILGMSIHPEYRRQGIGRKLVEHTVCLAEQKGFRSVDVKVYCHNKKMLCLLLNLNFIPTTMTYHARSDGVDIVHLKKYLSACWDI